MSQAQPWVYVYCVGIPSTYTVGGGGTDITAIPTLFLSPSSCFQLVTLLVIDVYESIGFEDAGNQADCAQYS